MAKGYAECISIATVTFANCNSQIPSRIVQDKLPIRQVPQDVFSEKLGK
jgi:hypothetical protein